MSTNYSGRLEQTYCLRVTAISKVCEPYPDTVWQTVHLLLCLCTFPDLLNGSIAGHCVASFGLGDGAPSDLGDIHSAWDTKSVRAERNGENLDEKDSRFTFATSVRHGRPLMSMPRPIVIAR